MTLPPATGSAAPSLGADADGGPDRATTFAALVAATLVSEIGFFIMPLLVGGIAESHRIDEGVVGFIITLQIAGFSATSLGLAPRIHRIDRRAAALAGVAAVAVGNLFTAAGFGLAGLVVARAVTGLGEGTLQAVSAAVASETRSPERTFSLLYLAVVVMSVAIFVCLPPVVAGLGPWATFAVLAGFAAVLAPALFWIPGATQAPEAVAGAGSPFTLFGVTALVAVFLFNLSANATWFYVERIGRDLGIDLAAIGGILAFASVAALAGPIGAYRLGTRPGRALPIVAASAVVGLGSLWLAWTSSPVGFTLGVTSASVALMFGAPYMMGLCAALDPAGRLAAAARGFGALGSVIAPSLAGGVLLLGGGFGGIGVASLAAGVAGALVVLPAARHADRETRAG